jgi:hypothetical protein
MYRVSGSFVAGVSGLNVPSFLCAAVDSGARTRKLPLHEVRGVTMDRETSTWSSGPVAITGADGHVGRARAVEVAELQYSRF